MPEEEWWTAFGVQTEQLVAVVKTLHQLYQVCMLPLSAVLHGRGVLHGHGVLHGSMHQSAGPDAVLRGGRLACSGSWL